VTQGGCRQPAALAHVRHTFFCTAATLVSSSGCDWQYSMWNLSRGLHDGARVTSGEASGVNGCELS
jgi:hypothetical protein